ncbi:DUF4424 domain-containing protein [Rhizomicrobium electricum]|uniref:DUF4424 domain-containing protein n=2 Tax=Rhizomicrobium electricum TaxID=480070 RepID=A0ABN1E5X5_9PROT
MRKTLMVIAAVVTVAPASADDGAAALAAGGIVFTHGTPVQMRSEELYVSPQKVRVRFEFFNPTKHDITTLVAFPLPDLEWDPAVGYGPMTRDPVNFVGFTVTVDGRWIKFQAEQRAILKGRDVTKLVNDGGLPVNAVSAGRRALSEKSKPIARNKKAEMVKLGILEDDTEYPNWTTRTRFYWTQVFAAGKTTVIEHEYQPVSGNWNTSRNLFDDPKLARQYCAKPEIARAAALTGPAYQTQYVLSTAKTWSGPIRQFHLTLDKLKPGNVLSLCWDGVLKRTGPTTFTFDANDYVPTRDIDMVVLE